jgi:hypothetical protein
MVKPSVPRNWRMNAEIYEAKKPVLAVFSSHKGNPKPRNNGSQNSRRNKKRPITLADRA